MRQPAALVLACVGAALQGCRAEPPERATTLELGRGPGTLDFRQVTQARAFRLPLDHGPHFGYQTEWWYFTGNLFAEAGRHFGYQLTFFRRGLSPGPPPPAPGLATNQIYFAHFAVTDTEQGTHSFAERWARGAGGLAGASGEPFAVFLEDWRAEGQGRDGAALALQARDGGFAIDLQLEAEKPLVAHGDRGLSAKSEQSGNASYYVSYTRLRASGRVTSRDRTYRVSGASWFDHEWSTSALGPGAVGWDWFSLQLDDGHELMFFRIRRRDGSLEPVSSGTWVAPDGRTRRLGRADLTLEAEGSWRSPETGAVYPSRWRLAVPSLDLTLRVEPWLDAQEMRTSFTYWEGAVRCSGERRGRPLEGRGYLELTGYAKSMQDVF
jgi:predicted secreted hydrolase